MIVLVEISWSLAPAELALPIFSNMMRVMRAICGAVLLSSAVGQMVEESEVVLDDSQTGNGAALEVLDPREAMHFVHDVMLMSSNDTRELHLIIINGSTGATHHANYAMEMMDDGDDEDFEQGGDRRLLTGDAFWLNVETEDGIDFPFHHFSCLGDTGSCAFHNEDSERRLFFGLIFRAVKFVAVKVLQVFAVPAITRAVTKAVAPQSSQPQSSQPECIAGDATFHTEDGFLQVSDIREGHTLRGVDFDGNEAMCRVVMKVFEGFASVYGNYTADHLMLASGGAVVTNGLHSAVRRDVPIYTVMTSNCVALTDAEGLQPTIFTSRTCGLAMNFTDLVSATKSAVELHGVFGDIVFHPQSWTGELHSETLVPLCIRMVRCSQNIAGCDALEDSVSRFVDANAKNSLVSAWQRSLTSHVVQNRIAGQTAEPVEDSSSHQCHMPSLMKVGAIAGIVSLAVTV